MLFIDQNEKTNKNKTNWKISVVLPDKKLLIQFWHLLQVYGALSDFITSPGFRHMRTDKA